ncbi:MAG: MFS transporter [Deltaproteobacteria bacterium]|nr:MFS transporter [Deltaproteobacteria bacterium]
MVQKRPILHWAWVILIICFIDLFINYSVHLGYGVLLPEMIRALECDRGAAGAIFNSYLFAYIVFTPIVGNLTDRLGGRVVITVCSLILGLGVFLMGTAQNVGAACFFFAIAGVGAAGMWTPALTLVQRWFAVHRRGLALGILSTSYGIGFAAMGVILPLLIDRFSWRLAWYLLGAWSLGLVVINGFLLKSDPIPSGYKPWGHQKGTLPEMNMTGKSGKEDTSLMTLFTDSAFYLIGFSYFAISYGLYGITTFMVDYAEYQLGLPLGKAGLLATIHGFCQIVGVLTVLPVSDFLGRKKAIIISNACITIALVGIVLKGNSWELLSVLVGCMAFFYGAIYPLYGACAGDYFPRAMMGTVIGVWTSFFGLGAMLTHWVSGMLRDSTGSYDHAFMVNTMMAFLGLLLMCIVRKNSVPLSKGGGI